MDYNSLTDEQLIFNFQKGDRKSYNILVHRYRDKLIRYLYGFTGDLDDAEDLVQETFLKVYIKKDSYKEIAKFSTWLYTIAGNLAKTDLRKIKRRKTGTFSSLKKTDGREFEPPEQIDDKNSNSIDEKEEKIIKESLLELDEDFRNIIILRENQELSYDVISKILKLPLGTVKSRINRGKLKLREILIKKGVLRI
tara:strand:+ start:572 stop:1156 length:585 start_codon:yes stop_codon:yes gene_type:complete